MITISILLLAVVSVFFMMGKFSARQTPLGVGSEQDFICGSNPNCVSSVGVQTSRQSVEPLNLAGLENAERSLLNAVRATGGQIRNIDAGMLTGSRMLNLDTEDWNELYVGCAGGAGWA